MIGKTQKTEFGRTKGVGDFNIRFSSYGVFEIMKKRNVLIKWTAWRV